MLAATPRALGLNEHSLATYYRAVADWMLPHLRGRPLGLLRSLREQDLPFFQKHAKKETPRALERVSIDGVDHLVIEERAGLFELPALEVLEIHVWGATRDLLDRPDRLIFDLDPGPDVSWKEVIEGAMLVEKALSARSIAGFPLVTGSRGIHLVCPLIPHATWGDARSFAKEVVEELASRYSSRFVTRHEMTERAGRIFIDHLRNDWGATSIAPYSTRARAGASVAAPVSWSELERISGPSAFDIESMPLRVAALEQDPWEELWKARQSL